MGFSPTRTSYYIQKIDQSNTNLLNYPMSKLLIIDSHAIAHRAYHSIPKLTHNGRIVNVLYGFYSILLSAVSQLKPKYVVICSDSPGPTFRNAEFIGYRAKRAIPDRDLISQFPLLDDSLKTAQLPLFAVGGYEADDLIATIARQALKKIGQKTKKNLIKEVIIITGDKDLMQLVGDRTKLFMPIRGLSETKMFGPPEVKEKLGVRPNQVVDLKALMGDSSDNYPGIPGVGPKTAVELLEKYQTLDNLYLHVDEIPGSTKDKFVSFKDDAYLSQKLAQLIDNIPLVKFRLKDARWTPDRLKKLSDVFESYGFRSLVSRLRSAHGLKKDRLKLVDHDQPTLF